MTWNDLVLFTDRQLQFLSGGHSLGMVRIRSPKMKATGVQHVLIELPWVRSVLTFLKQEIGRVGTAPILACGPVALRKRWDRMLQWLGCDKDIVTDDRCVLEKRYTPGSLRAGGATSDYLRNQSLSRLQWRGRWQSFGTLRHYLQLGAYHLTTIDMDEAQRTRVHRCCAVWESFANSCHDGGILKDRHVARGRPAAGSRAPVLWSRARPTPLLLAASC